MALIRINTVYNFYKELNLNNLYSHQARKYVCLSVYHDLSKSNSQTDRLKTKGYLTL